MVTCVLRRIFPVTTVGFRLTLLRLCDCLNRIPLPRYRHHKTHYNIYKSSHHPVMCCPINWFDGPSDTCMSCAERGNYNETILKIEQITAAFTSLIIPASVIQPSSPVIWHCAPCWLCLNYTLRRHH